MLNNFCFDVFAQKWVFVIMSHVTCCMSHVACHMSHVLCQMLMLILGTCWTIFVFMSMLQSHCLWVKIAMPFCLISIIVIRACVNWVHWAALAGLIASHPVNRSRICFIYVVLKLGAILTSLRPNFYGRVPHDNVTKFKSSNDAVLNVVPFHGKVPNVWPS